MMSQARLSHSITDGPPIPEMVQAVLSFQDLAALKADLESLTNVRNVAGKTGAKQHASAVPLTLHQGIEQLRQGDLPALQIVYDFDGHTWTDTLFRLPEGARLVRCQHSTPP